MAGFFAGQNKPAPLATKEMEEEGKIPRDRWDRPMIWLPDGSKRVAYARASSYGGQLEDKSALEKWGKRQMLRGAAINPSIIERVPQGPARERGGEVGYQDKKTLDRLVEQADEAVGSQDKAALGTAIHYGTEVVDLGGSLADLTPLVRNRADAYYRACREAGLVMTSVEQFGVEDVNQVAGTWDRLGYVPFWPGKIQRVLDVKTSGSMDFAGIGFAVQLAEYTRMKRYDPETGERVPHETMDLDNAIIIHVDREMDGPVTLHKVDVAAGWRYSQLAREVILARRVGTKVITDIDELDIVIGAAGSLEELHEAFETTGAGWDAKHRELASMVAARLRGLPV